MQSFICVGMTYHFLYQIQCFNLRLEGLIISKVAYYKQNVSCCHKINSLFNQTKKSRE